MPLGNPEAYMAQGMPPDQAMAMAGGMPPMGPGAGVPMDPSMMMPPPDPMEMLLSAVMGKWDSQEAALAGERSLLFDTLSMIAGSQPPMPQEMFAEGAPTNVGLVPQDEVAPMGPGSVPTLPY